MKTAEKAWDDWKDDLIVNSRTNKLFHEKVREVNYTEPFTLEEFKAVLLEKSPVFLFNTMYSSTKPLYQLTKQTMPSGVTYFCTSSADKTPKTETWEQFYKSLRNDMNHLIF